MNALLTGLLAEAHTDPAREPILATLARDREAAAVLIADEDLPDARAVLEAAEKNSPSASRDLAAFELFQGRLPERIKALREELQKRPDSSIATTLALYARAAGDLPAARQAAEKSANEELLNYIIIDQADWPEMARRAHASNVRTPLSILVISPLSSGSRATPLASIAPPT